MVHLTKQVEIVGFSISALNDEAEIRLSNEPTGQTFGAVPFSATLYLSAHVHSDALYALRGKKLKLVLEDDEATP